VSDQTTPTPTPSARIGALATDALDLVERSGLDERQKRTLKLVAQGRLAYRAIAREYGYRSPGSVHRHARPGNQGCSRDRRGNAVKGRLRHTPGIAERTAAM